MSALHVGCCISAHGFGHAARTMAIMEALSRMIDIELTLVTAVPEWFLRNSCSCDFTLHHARTDVGLVQKTPLEQDVPATIQALHDFYPVRPETVRSLAGALAGCRLVVCDIAPAGILAARQNNIPSVLVENFTWDWIYEEYSASFPALKPFITYLDEVTRMARYRIQTIPVCRPAAADLQAAPVARAFRESPAVIRQRLGVEKDQQLILVSMGGVGIDNLPLERLRAEKDAVFVITGYRGGAGIEDNLRLLGPDTGLYHPDLVRASDAVIGKAGYSTLAEVYHADVPFGYVSRPDFRESGPLADFIRKEMSSLEIDPQDFWSGQWVDAVPELLRQGKKGRIRENGAARCAGFLRRLPGRLEGDTGGC